MPEWGDVRFFLEVSRAGTLAAAGRKLGVDNTTVGRRLAALERDLGSRLFERTPEGLVLTAAGEAIRGAGEEMEKAALLVEQRALGADRKLAGLVRVATTEMLGQIIVLPAVLALRERHPQIRVDLATGTGRLDIARREADVALRYLRPSDGDLISRRAGRIAWTAYASRAYLAARPRPVRGTGFAGHDLVALDPNIAAWRQATLAGETLGDVRVVMRTNSVLTLGEAVAMGLGVGSLPCWLGDDDRRLRRVFPEAPLDVDDLWLVVHADVQRTSRVRAVIEALDTRLTAIASVLGGETRRR